MLILPRNWQGNFQLLLGMKSSGFWDISLGQIESCFRVLIQETMEKDMEL